MGTRRSLNFMFFFFLLASVVWAQAPISEGPTGRMAPGPGSPSVIKDDPVPWLMVRIPGGEFEMGDHSGLGYSDEIPVHAVYIDSFSMDVNEVTNRQYCDFLNSAYGQGLIEVNGNIVYQAGSVEPYCDTNAYDPDSRIFWNGSKFSIAAGKKGHPMVEVSWYGAAAYANWRSTEDGLTPCYDISTWACNYNADGYRMPTEAEWEYAARGGEKNPYYIYPWGDDLDGSKANYWYSGDPYEFGVYPLTTPVGYYNGSQSPPGYDMVNAFGLYDMAGNVWEWCNDWYDEYYYSTSPYDNPIGPASGTYRVLRGGSWNLTYDFAFVRCAFRYGYEPDYRGNSEGFRLVRD